jgi:putative oxidoreductase
MTERARLEETSAPLGPPARQGNTAFAISVALLLLRLVFGWVFFYAGAGKAFGWFGGYGIEGTAKFIGPIMPAFLSPTAWTYLLAYAELLGGLLVMLGLLTRLASIPLLITMLVAIKVATGMNGFGGYVNENGLQMGYAYNLVLATLAIAFILTGPGLIAADAFLFRKGFWARGPQPLSEPTRRG